MTATPSVAGNSTLQAYLDQQAKNIAADQANASSTANSSAATSSIGKNFDTFIKILTTQLQHQDPTNATDPNQFTQELVQFAGVEQQLGTNTKLDQLIALQNARSGAVAALGYIGQYVEVPTLTGTAPLQDGGAEIGYTLPTTASSVSIAVQDSTGKTVATLSGATAQGLNYLKWDGKDSTGAQLADGNYTFNIKAIDASTNAAETLSDVRVIGKVTGVSSNSDGTANLSLGGVSVGATSVDSVYSLGNLPQATAA